MITLIAAAALAAQAPVAPAGPADAGAKHEHMQKGQAGEHKGMDCCKDCCKDMAGKHEHGSDHQGHSGH